MIGAAMVWSVVRDHMVVPGMEVAGHGVAWLPKSILQRELADDTLVACSDLDDIAIDIRIYRHEALRKQATQMWDQIEG